ncbi:carbohydrate porin [Cetobacterium sp.]|uniref:carbohydrate porin n=1 Tax=Cetobacterium sp. TaxID=2071632 RepID=UPI003F328B80
MKREKLVFLGCLLVAASSLAAKPMTLEQRVIQLEKLLEKQAKETEQIQDQVIEKKKNTKEDVALVTRVSKLEKEAELWEVHGYASLQYRSTEDGSSSSTNFGKGDYFLGLPGTGESSNQVELVVKRKFFAENGVFGDLNLRAEYGNGDSYYYSSSGSEHDNGKGQFEVKEAFINMGGFSYLPEGATIWGGRRFLNRNSTLLSGEFYKQSSGVGFGYERNGLSLAVVGVDPGAEDGKDSSNLGDGLGRRTMTSFDFNYAGIKVPGGNLDLGAKYYIQPNARDADEGEGEGNPDAAKNGFGVGFVYNTNYYGFDGFASHAFNYGYGVGAHATGGMNFGQWTDGGLRDAYTMLATTSGLVNLNEKWQVATELSALHGDKLYGLSGELTRVGFSFQPSYKVNDNFRMVLGAAVGAQNIEDHKTNWGGQEKETQVRYGFSVAPTFTLSSDYFGRPQIQPYVTWVKTNFESGLGGDLQKEKSQIIFGVKSEVWF